MNGKMELTVMPTTEVRLAPNGGRAVGMAVELAGNARGLFERAGGWCSPAEHARRTQGEYYLLSAEMVMLVDEGRMMVHVVGEEEPESMAVRCGGGRGCCEVIEWER